MGEGKRPAYLPVRVAELWGIGGAEGRVGGARGGQVIETTASR